MEIDRGLIALKRLQGFYGKKLTPEALAFYLDEFRLLPDNVFNLAVSECQRTERTFPTITVLNRFILEARQRVAEVEKRRRSLPTMSDLTEARAGDTEYVRESRRILQRIALPVGDPMHLSGKNLVAEMRTMEKAFPGRGWASNADELDDFLNRCRSQTKAV